MPLESPADIPFAIVTPSPVVSDGVLYSGMASVCKARGSVVAAGGTAAAC